MNESYKKLKQRWWLMGGAGAVCVGAGLSGAIESGYLKHTDGVSYWWVIGGTVSLSILIIGLDILFRANRLRIKIDQLKDTK